MLSFEANFGDIRSSCSSDMPRARSGGSPVPDTSSATRSRRRRAEVCWMRLRTSSFEYPSTFQRIDVLGTHDQDAVAHVVRARMVRPLHHEPEGAREFAGVARVLVDDQARPTGHGEYRNDGVVRLESPFHVQRAPIRYAPPTRRSTWCVSWGCRGWSARSRRVVPRRRCAGSTVAPARSPRWRGSPGRARRGACSCRAGGESDR